MRFVSELRAEMTLQLWGERSIKYRLGGIGASRSMGCAVRAGSAWGGWRALFNGEKLPGEDVGVFYLDEVKVLSECMVGET